METRRTLRQVERTVRRLGGIDGGSEYLRALLLHFPSILILMIKKRVSFIYREKRCR